jgi:hypothetical protein
MAAGSILLVCRDMRNLERIIRDSFRIGCKKREQLDEASAQASANNLSCINERKMLQLPEVQKSIRPLRTDGTDY